MILSHPGFCSLRVQRVVHQLVFEVDLIIDYLIFPMKHVQFMRIVQIPPGKDVHITQIKIPLRYTPVEYYRSCRSFKSYRSFRSCKPTDKYLDDTNPIDFLLSATLSLSNTVEHRNGFV